MKVIIFDDKINGHHLEYIHHLYEIAVSHSEHQFIFVLPNSYNQVCDKFIWKKAHNVSFELISEEILNYPEGSFINSLKKSFCISKLLGVLCEKYNAEILFMNSLMLLIPGAIFYIKKSVMISGIIYQIYLYRDKRNSILGKILDRLKYIILSYHKVFRNIFILNDIKSTEELNLIYKTKKFKYLSDPYITLEPENIDIRKEYNIPVHHKLFIHIGALEKRKGTLNILTSIMNLPLEDYDRYTFFFAGKIDNEIRSEFYNYLKKIKHANIIVKDEFCTYGFFASLCKASDAILMPYLIDSASSGIIGYASQFTTPVIATSTGLIGKLIKEYKLGYLLTTVNNETLIQSYRYVFEGLMDIPNNMYCQTHTINDFKREICTIFEQ